MEAGEIEGEVRDWEGRGLSAEGATEGGEAGDWEGRGSSGLCARHTMMCPCRS